MKERLIAFTRNKKSKTKLIIAEVAICIIFIALVQFGIIGKLNIAIRLIASISAILIVFGISYICKFFDLDEKIIRNNRISTIIMAYTDIVGDLLVFFFLITIIPIPKLNMLTIIMIIIGFSICYIVSKRVNVYFRQKLEIE